MRRRRERVPRGGERQARESRRRRKRRDRNAAFPLWDSFLK